MTEWALDMILLSQPLLHSAPPFLSSPLGAFRNRWLAGCVGLLVGRLFEYRGFVPLGFFFTAYFSLVRPIRRPRVMVLLFGLTLSLFIEITQYFLPTRASSMTDVITNTLGTAIGVAICQPILNRILRSWPVVAGAGRNV